MKFQTTSFKNDKENLRADALLPEQLKGYQVVMDKGKFHRESSPITMVFERII